MAEPTLILPRWIVPIEPDGVVLEGQAVVLREARIEAVLDAQEACARYADAERVELPEHALLPGLVNAHTHAAMTLMRGLADDLPLMRWLNEHIWPVEMRHVTPEFVRDGTLIACAEMLRGGITCFNDMYFYPEAALEAAQSAGMRAVMGMIVVDFPTAYASDPDDYLQKGLALRDRYRDEPLASFCLAPHAPYTVSDDALRKVAMLAGNWHTSGVQARRTSGQSRAAHFEVLAALSAPSSGRRDLLRG
ncbi:MAG: amidohydrolase family protein, partial [Burkholderiales bacterium]